MPDKELELPKRKERVFLEESFKVENWEQIMPLYEELNNREINRVEDLEKWLSDKSELDAALAEELGWRYIRMTCNTTDEKVRDQFNYFVEEIEPNIAPYSNKLDKKILASPYLDQLQGEAYYNLIRHIRKDDALFREENIPLQTQIQTEQQEYGAIAGAMTVTVNGEELTLQQAADFLQSTDRALREDVYRKIQSRRYEDKDKLDALFDSLLKLRHQVALNTGFANFRDYMFASLGRFDYTPQDCFSFHAAVAEAVTPMLDGLAEERKAVLGVKQLRPWDLDVDKEGKEALKPFRSAEELTDKTIECFYRLDTYLGNCLAIMKRMGHLDLDSRKGKAPGGYNYPLDEIGVPFIFMNATSNLRDMVTMLHEGGHAVHSFLTRDIGLNFFKHPPSEVAELASMSMELISMDHWDLFFSDKEELRRAKKEHLEQIIETLPWVATIDKFQHWLYENPEHTIEQRQEEWNKIHSQFSSNVIDWAGLEHFKKYIWQKQLHIYEVPFYYIEYGIAQLGAVAVWKNFREDPHKGLDGYMAALKIGYKAPITKIYEAAGIRFDFSKEYIKELMDFVKAEMEAC
jgi:oligoendopeptidase F